EYRIVWSDASVHWIAAKARCFYDASGNPTKMMGTTQDITARKQAEEDLRRSEEFNRRILESSSDCIKLIDLDGHLLYMNTGGMCLMEIEDLASVLNQDWVCFWKGEAQEAAQEALAIAKAGEFATFQGYCPTFKQTPKWWDVVVTPIRDAAEQVVQLLVISRDITDRKQAELERERLLEQEQIAREAAERASRVKDEFLAILSHELRSPLNPILGWIQMMQTYQLDADKINQAVTTIDRNARLLTQLIDDLLDIARILRGKLALNVTTFNLELAIEAAIETVQTAAEAKSIAIKTNFSPVGQIKGDFTRLQQIMWNLLTNAVKFTPDGGTVEIQLQQIGKRAQISVSDTGKGISPEFLPHVFEYFRQADASVTRNHGGLGLGLAIVHHLVELHGGEVTVTSPGVGQGATFIVQLPLLSTNSWGAAKKSETTAAKIAPNLPSLQGIRVLVVDDDSDNCELLAMLLEQYQAEVMTVASAMEVSSVLKSFKPDILVSDIGMPDVDGYTLLRSIRCLPPEQGGQIPAIAVTAYARPEDAQQALACGFQRHLSKPIDANQLVIAIAELTKS
ncbi:MAG: hybrid sensor histidine kinase/response regulator, partial [Waterburya sp.]